MEVESGGMGSAGRNATPNLTQNNYEMNLSATYNDPRLLEAMARQNEENMHLQNQRQELYEAGQRVTQEAEQLFSENHELEAEARQFVMATRMGYDVLSQEANSEFHEMRQAHQQQINELHQQHFASVVNFQNELSSQQFIAQTLQAEVLESMQAQRQLMEEVREMRRSQNAMDRAPGGPERQAANGLRDDRELIPDHGNTRIIPIVNPPGLNSSASWQMVGNVGQPLPPDQGPPLSPITMSPSLTLSDWEKRLNLGPGEAPQPGGGGGPPNQDPPDEKQGNGKKSIKLKTKGGGGGGGDGGGDDDDDGNESDDSDSDSEIDNKALKKLLKRVFTKTAKSSDDGNKAKEADTVKIPAFPLPETYRNWKIRVRDAVRAASSKPDKAFDWINEVWKEGQTVEKLKDPKGFVTLDAKVLSALSSIASGEFARKVDTFKEKESLEGRPVRGRQVLLMVHEYFSTNIKHGATYSLADLFNVKLKGENLRTFMTNWETVTTGVSHMPDDSILETLFYQQVKGCKAIAHDIQEYERAEEGTEKHCYQFLVQAVHRYLMRNRLEGNRERIAASFGGSKPSTPAVGERGPYIPKGYCIAWNKGGCSKEGCTFKHETPPKRSKTPSRGRSASRDKAKKDKGKVHCKFWKAGRCKRGSECTFSHEGSQRPRKATPARSASKGSQGSDKSKKGKKKNPRGKSKEKRSSSKDSQASKGSNNSKSSKGSRSSGKGPSPAAVCLVASMLASMAEGYASNATRNGLPICASPVVRFNDHVDTCHIRAVGDMLPYLSAKSIPNKTFPVSYKTFTDSSVLEDSILSARMLSGAVSSEIKGVHSKCQYLCDSDIGCDDCIPKELVAMPAQVCHEVRRYQCSNEDWIADTGSAQDLLTRADIPDEFQFFSDKPIGIITANGESSSNLQAKVYNGVLDCKFEPYLLESTPPVLSVGMRCMDQGYDFIWRAGKFPYFRKPDGKKINLVVRDYVPYVANCKNENKIISTPTVPSRPLTVPKPDPPQRPQEDLHQPAAPAEASRASDDDEGLMMMSEEKGEAHGNVTPEEEKVGQCIGEKPSRSEKETSDIREIEASRNAPPIPISDDGSGVSDEGALARNRGKGVQILKQEALSLGHLISHHPKNPFCDVCKRAKMSKSPSYRVEGSSQVDSKKFGDHITCDFLVTGDDYERGIDDEKAALVVKDVYSNFIYVYPSARRSVDSVVLAMKHFTSNSDEVGVCYSDNAPELVGAFKSLLWRHVQSKGYVSQSNAVAERAIRTILDGTRVNLLQSGLGHQYWPHAARHWCIAHDSLLALDSSPSPWELRFDAKCPMKVIPFGSLVHYWNGPKKRPKDELRFDPTSTPGIFLGYVIHPGFLWRDEYVVANLKAVMDARLEDTVQIYRVSKIQITDKFEFPLKDRKLVSLMDQPKSTEEGTLPDLELQDAVEQEDYEPSIAEIEGTTDDPDRIQAPMEGAGSKAVWHKGWLKFLNSGLIEGWTDYADYVVKYERNASHFPSPEDKVRTTTHTIRTVVVKSGESSWHVIEENEPIHPWSANYARSLGFVGEVVSIFSKFPVDVRTPEAEPSKLPDDDEIEVYNPVTGKKEVIKSNDPKFYDAGGFKARRYKGSSKPEHIPPFVWQSMSTKQRREAIAKEQKKLALEQELSKLVEEASSSSKPKTKRKGTAVIGAEVMSDEDYPRMPTSKSSKSAHRDKLVNVKIMKGEKVISSLVARPVNRKEIRANPKAQASLDVEWLKLVDKKAWLYDTVTEWKEVAAKAKRTGKKVHVGKVFEICVEKGSELPAGSPLRKFKGRTVFQGNNVRDENSDVALFSELGSSPATMEAGKAVDAYGSQPGFSTQQADGKQAYTQALMKGVETWVEIPRDRWPKEWEGKFERPVMLLRIALYGHPDSGGLWELHCETMLIEIGFIMPDREAWPSMFFHARLKLLLIVYVDDFKMSGPKESIEEGWRLIATKIDLDEPGPVGRYLGCEHVYQEDVKLSVNHHPFAHVFDKSLPDPAAKPAAVSMTRTQDYWEYEPDSDIYVRHHMQPRRTAFQPDQDIIEECDLSGCRMTEMEPCMPERIADREEIWDEAFPKFHHNNLWVGTTYLFTKRCKDPKQALATIKRDKGTAKKQARSENFAYLDQLKEDQECMTKPVNIVTYDMKPFLQSCVDRYIQLAGKDAQSLKKVTTPFHEERIARPVADEKETKGVLAPIAARILMKILFAARMARFDLLRAVQGLAARVTKWSEECDKALHRLVCYINSSLDYKAQAFIGDAVEDCNLWLFADADHAGEYDNRSTSGCVLVLVGPNTYFPLTAFSKKQTSVAMSSTESEVVSANVSLRSVGLPSSGLWAYLQKAGGIQNPRKPLPGRKQGEPERLPMTFTVTKADKDGDHWEYDPGRRSLTRVHSKGRSHLFIPTAVTECPVSLSRLGSARTTIHMDGKNKVDYIQDNWRTRGEYPTTQQWTGKTVFRVYGPDDVDYKIESQEIREALTDWEFIGMEREGSLLISMFSPHSIQGVFVEDNQATIRINPWNG